DLFSLGCVLYAMCTGLAPFRAASALAVLRQVCDEAPAPLRGLNPAVPAWLEALVARLLAKGPQDRFQSAAEVAALLQGYLAPLGHPEIPPPELPPPPAGARAGGRWRALPLLAALATLVLPGSFLVCAALRQDETPQDPEMAVAALRKLGAK